MTEISYEKGEAVRKCYNDRQMALDKSMAAVPTTGAKKQTSPTASGSVHAPTSGDAGNLKR